jgi:hypothetical protein
VSMITTVKNSALVVGASGVLSLGGLAIAPSTYALTINFGSAQWQQTGNVTTPSAGNATLLTNPGSTDALSSSTLQDFLGLAPGALDLNSGLDNATQGSALKINVNAGDTISFNWLFSSTEPLTDAKPDYAFLVENGVVIQTLATAPNSLNSSFTKTFTTAGLFGIGIVDIVDVDNASTLSITNGDFAPTPTPTPVPTPALLPGMIGIGLGMLRKRKQQSVG